jgi:DNA-binding protein H-NS
MGEILNVLTRKTSLRKACKELSASELDKLFENLSDLISERKQEDAAMEAERAQKQANIDAIKKQMADAGVDLGDLLATQEAAPAAKPKGAVKPKYQIDDGEGGMLLWTGRGRTPKLFQAYFDKGGSKDDCLIG